MVVIDNRPSKRMKRSNNRVAADHYDVFKFPPSSQADVGEPFRNSVKAFLRRHASATFQVDVFPSMLTWQVVLRVGDLVEGPDLAPVTVVLEVVEEDVTRSTKSVYCDQCRVVGWGSHPVCRKRYHFILRANSGYIDGCHKSCARCGNLRYISESSCKWCNFLITGDGVEDWFNSQFEDNSHLLHGVVHANGYGHLLTLNGREGGSSILSGCDVMNFWDRLCSVLAVRKISVMDVARKYGLEYRVLHAIAKGHSWYGEWDYDFESGSYGLTQDAYRKAVDTLSRMPLSSLLFQRQKLPTRLQGVIAFYQSLSDLELLTLGDLFCFLLKLIHELKTPQIKSEKLKPSFSHALCAWTRDDVENVQQAMIKVLIAAGDTKLVRRRALKGVMCKEVSSELLDYCLKHMVGKLASDGKMVQARYSPDSNDLEFRLESISFFCHGTGLGSYHPSEEQVKQDVQFLYDSLLNPKASIYFRRQVIRDHVTNLVTKILDCKQFIKDYKPDRSFKQTLAIHLWCHLDLSDRAQEDQAPPPELIVLPTNARVIDLKNEATKVFQEVYPAFKRFGAEELPEYGSIEDALTLKLLIGSSGSVTIRGRCYFKHMFSHFRMERGIENWTVDCTCGAKDDDGERMLACDTCGVWQHTRCAGIDGSDAIPVNFICERCMHSWLKIPEVENLKSETNIVPLPGMSTCRREAGAPSPIVVSRLTVLG